MIRTWLSFPNGIMRESDANDWIFIFSGSEFHVPGQNYGAQPGGQVGGGGGNVGVPGGRGPPPLGGIQSIGQSTTGIPPGGPAAGQQAPPQAPTPGVQPQQPQGPAPTTTPPVHTPSPQEMGKQGHLQTQPIPVFVPNQQRAASTVSPIKISNISTFPIKSLYF